MKTCSSLDYNATKKKSLTRPKSFLAHHLPFTTFLTSRTYSCCGSIFILAIPLPGILFPQNLHGSVPDFAHVSAASLQTLYLEIPKETTCFYLLPFCHSAWPCSALFFFTALGTFRNDFTDLFPFLLPISSTKMQAARGQLHSSSSLKDF